jgi:hypothetical protein
LNKVNTWEDISCPNLKTNTENSDEKICTIASDLKGRKIKTNPYACAVCSNAGISAQKAGNVGMNLILLEDAKERNETLYQSAEEMLGVGVGTELHKMIPKFLERPTCNCKSWAKKMNVWGVSGCEANREVIVDRLINESNKSPLFAWVPDSATRSVCHKLVSTAINRAKKNESKEKHKWFVAVTTAPRPQETLSICLDSLLIAGWNPYIFAEPGNYNINEEYKSRMIKHDTRKGVWWNWIESCRYALEHSDADVIMTVQDDSLFHPDSKSMAERFLWPREDVGFVSLYTPKHYSVKNHLKSKPERPRGLNRIATKSLWGACALIWPRDVLERVMKHELIDSWLGAKLKTVSAWEARKEKRRQEPWTIQNSDTAIGKIMNRMERSMWFADPSPVQHIATTSAIGHGGNKGRRNCGRCAKFSESLHEQLPFVINGAEIKELFDADKLVF